MCTRVPSVAAQYPSLPHSAAARGHGAGSAIPHHVALPRVTLRSSVYDTVRRTPRSIIAHTKREVELNSEVAAAIVMLGGGPPLGP